jgi:hypothetical protein
VLPDQNQVGGLQRKDPSVAVDLDAPPPTDRILGLHHLATDAIELGLLLERVDFDVCAAPELRGELQGRGLMQASQHRLCGLPSLLIALVVLF